MGMRRHCDGSDRCDSFLFDDDDSYCGDGDDDVVMIMMLAC